METKSRYEVIAELEDKKRALIVNRDSLDDVLKGSERELKKMKREIEDKEEDIKNFKDSMKEQKETIQELIKSIDEGLDRFASINKKS